MEVQPVSVSGPGHDGRSGQRTQTSHNTNEKRKEAALETESLIISFVSRLLKERKGWLPASWIA